MACPHTYTTTKRANLRQIMTTAKKKTYTACLSKFVFVCISMGYSALRQCELLKKVEMQASDSPASNQIYLKGDKTIMAGSGLVSAQALSLLHCFLCVIWLLSLTLSPLSCFLCLLLPTRCLSSSCLNDHTAGKMTLAAL